MTGRRFGRVARLEILSPSGSIRRLNGGQDDLRISFDATHDGSVTASGGTFTVSNLTNDSAAALSEDGAGLRIYAGYAEDAGPVLIMEGSIVSGSLRDDTQGIERTTGGRISDGGQTLRDSVISLSIRSGATASAILEQVRSELGATRGPITLGNEITFSSSFVFSGPARQLLRDLAEDTGSNIQIKDGRLSAYPIFEVNRPGIIGELISVRTGMIGSPRLTDRGVSVTSLLIPGMRNGDSFRIQASEMSGDYVAISVRHLGDTAGTAPFQTVIEGRRR